VFAPPAGSGAVSVATPVNLPQSGQVYPRRMTPGGRKIQSCTSRARGCMGPCSASSTDSWQSGPSLPSWKQYGECHTWAHPM